MNNCIASGGCRTRIEKNLPQPAYAKATAVRKNAENSEKREVSLIAKTKHLEVDL
jgi:hypothetical protein